jgi:hypothetical protein
MSGYNPNQFSQGGSNYFQQAAKNQRKAYQEVDVSEAAVEKYRQDRDDPALQRKRMLQKIKQQRADMQEQWAESKRHYEEVHGAIEAGFGGPSSSGGGGDSELGLDYLA